MGPRTLFLRTIVSATARRIAAAALAVAALVAGVFVLPGGEVAAAASGGPRVLQVVAAENFWGSLAAQLGGSDARVTSVVTDPNADPHEYETSPTDARAMARADYVIVNGAGYDDWAQKLLSAQGRPGRRVLTVATLLGQSTGDNPHFWYDPSYVARVVARITADYRSLDPGQAAYFTSRAAALDAAFAPYRARLAGIRARFAGTPVAATESIFVDMAQYLHLDLVTPYPFMKAVAEGGDPPAGAEATFVRQIRGKSFDVLVYNSQTITPLTTGIKAQTAAQHIPVIGVSETMPPGTTFEAWMTGELDALASGLASGRANR